MNTKLFYIGLIILLQACSYSQFGNGNKSRDILLKPGLRWKVELSTNYYLNGAKACEGKAVTYRPRGKGCTRFVYKKDAWKYWDPNGNLVWTENYKFDKRTARTKEAAVIINEMPDSIEIALDSLFYNKKR